MSPTATTDTSLAALGERVSAAAAAFPADGLVAGPADSQSDVAELLPADDALVLVSSLEGAPEHRLVVVVSPALLTPMGLADADGLADALAPVLAVLAGSGAHEPGRVGIGPIGLAEVPPSGDGAVLVAAGLFLGSEHVATLGVGVADGAPALDEPAAVPPAVVPPAAVPGPEGQAGAGPAPAPVAHDAATAMDLPDVGPVRSPGTDPSGARSLDLLRNVEMNVTAELGRSKMTVADLLSLTPGAVVELDRSAGTPIDVLVNGTLIARGEVVVIDEEFGVRISEIVDRIEGA